MYYREQGPGIIGDEVLCHISYLCDAKAANISLCKVEFQIFHIKVQTYRMMSVTILAL